MSSRRRRIISVREAFCAAARASPWPVDALISWRGHYGAKLVSEARINLRRLRAEGRAPQALPLDETSPHFLGYCDNDLFIFSNAFPIVHPALVLFSRFEAPFLTLEQLVGLAKWLASSEHTQLTWGLNAPNAGASIPQVAHAQVLPIRLPIAELKPLLTYLGPNGCAGSTPEEVPAGVYVAGATPLSTARALHACQELLREMQVPFNFVGTQGSAVVFPRRTAGGAGHPAFVELGGFWVVADPRDLEMPHDEILRRLHEAVWPRDSEVYQLTLTATECALRG